MTDIWFFESWTPSYDDTRFKYAILPYVKGVSECLQRVFSSYNVKLCFKANSTFGGLLTKLKDIIEKGENSDLVYKLLCSDCPVNYIGETQQNLSKRFYQHRAALRRGDSNHSGMVEHCLQYNHDFSFDNVQILEKNLKFYKVRKTMEPMDIRLQRRLGFFSSRNL